MEKERTERLYKNRNNDNNFYKVFHVFIDELLSSSTFLKMPVNIMNREY